MFQLESQKEREPSYDLRRWDDITKRATEEACLLGSCLDVTACRYGPMAGSFEHGNEPSGSIKMVIS
jgi:hypothetical protein